MTLDIDKPAAAAEASHVVTVHEDYGIGPSGREFGVVIVGEATADFVCDARQHVLDLVGEVRRLRTQVGRLLDDVMQMADANARMRVALREAIGMASDGTSIHWTDVDFAEFDKRIAELRQLADATTDEPKAGGR